jgi:hypothetical protein
MRIHLQVVSIIASALLLIGIVELVRRRRLQERYAIVWLFSAVVLLALAIWERLLARVAHVIGVYYAPSALFVIAFTFVLLLLLHFSVTVSRLAEQSKVLAQKLALLEQRVSRQAGAGGDADDEPELAVAAAQSEYREQERREEDL